MYKKFLLTIMIFLLMILTGCWDRFEPEKLAIVRGAGFDYNEEKDLYKIIFQIASPLTMQGPGGGGGGGEAPNFWTVSAWGHTPYDAIANISKKVSRKIVFHHAQLYIFSEKMARTKGILPIMNGVARSRQSRRVIILAVAKKDVENILTEKLPIESSNVMGLTSQIKLTMEEMGGATVENARDFFIKLVQPGLEPYAVAMELIEYKEEPEKDKKEKESEADTGMKAPVRITGKYLLHDDKVVGLYDDRETRGCNWIVGRVKSGTLVLKYPGNEDARVDVIATEGSSKIEPHIKDGKPAITLSIKASGRIISIIGLSNTKGESEITKSLEKRMEEVIRNDIKLALKKAQDLKTDVFGFGFAFYRKKHDKWQEMKDNWDDIFANLPVEIKVEATIKRTGMVNKGPEIK